MTASDILEDIGRILLTALLIKFLIVAWLVTGKWHGFYPKKPRKRQFT